MQPNPPWPRQLTKAVRGLCLPTGKVMICFTFLNENDHQMRIGIDKIRFDL